MVLPPKPTTGRSNGTPISFDGRPGMARKLPPRTSKAQFNWISTFSCVRATSQGSGRRSQLSGCSCCQPSWIVCLKIPYS